MSDLGAFNFNVNELPPDTRIGSGNGASDNAPPPAPEIKSKRDTDFIVGGLEKFYHNTGMMLFIVNQHDGAQIAKNAHDLAESWRNLLDTDAKLRRRMMKMLEAGGWSTVVTAHLIVAIPIMQNHGVTLEHLIKRPKARGMEEEEGLSDQAL